MQFLYVVEVLHRTGHGESSGVALITPHRDQAIKTAFEIEKLGYEFSGETGVGVVRMDIGRTYHKQEFKFAGSPRPGHPLVMWRRHYKGVWGVEWFDDSARRQHHHQKGDSPAKVPDDYVI